MLEAEGNELVSQLSVGQFIILEFLREAGYATIRADPCQAAPECEVEQAESDYIKEGQCTKGAGLTE